MHLVGADLYLQGLAIGANNSGVERPVHIILRSSYEVVEFAGDRAPQAVHNSQHGIALLNRVNDDAYAPHVVDLIEGQAFAIHLLIDRVNVFGPS